MSKISDAISYLRANVSGSKYPQLMSVLTKDQNQSILKLVMLSPTSPEFETKGKEFIASISEDQKSKLTLIVGKDVIDKLIESIK